MKRIVLMTGAAGLALALAALSLDAGRGGHGGHGGGGGGGGGGGVAHTGSVHFGGRVDEVHVGGAAVVHPGVVHGEPRMIFAGDRGRYRNPYRDDYFRRFPLGFRTILLGDALYYIYDTLPFGCPPVIFNGITYYSCNGLYYQPYIYGGQTVYMVAPI